MIRYEFVDPKEEWIGINHYRAWRDRMQSIAPNFRAKEGLLVFYSFDATSYESAKALTQLAFCETKTGIHQDGAGSSGFGCA